MHARQLEPRLAHEVVDDALRRRRVGKVGRRVERLQGVVRVVFELLCRRPLDLAVDVCASAAAMMQDKNRAGWKKENKTDRPGTLATSTRPCG